MSPERPEVRVETRDGIGIATIDRPAFRNALNRSTVGLLRSVLGRWREDPSVGCVVFTGAGDEVFVSGADIRELRERTPADALDAINSGLFQEIEKYPKPTIAAVNGAALGGGCELAIACDLRVAVPNARFGQPETGLGIVPGAGGTQRLPRLVGWGRARDLVLTGRVLPAEEALSWGLVTRLAPAGAAVEAACQIAREILRRGPLATRLAKAALNLATQVPQDAGQWVEILAQAVTFGSADKTEGMSAFLEKRPARFTGR
ncbi:MAG: enoyl-CoA hydratase/isomerase family protein [Planctomycetes bacterium]|nr:enoyl-CoA hydratase/isomerase family protein [Planctomycetota bacterium]